MNYKSITVSLPTELIGKVEKKAEETGASFSGIVKLALKKWLPSKEGNHDV